ncbi:hypothetical protein GGF46_002057 [Coemansia sp. RSA 552]|nr:hypothetical protein GGF46_002057 [Coemansia sp. RSA 552]
MEAAIDNKRAVALSFAFYNRDISEAKALNASHIACSILKKLWSSDAWKASGSSVFNVNIPLVDDPSPPVHITRMGTSRFGSLYKKIEDAPGSSSIPRAQGKGEIDNSGLSTSQKRMRIAVDDGSSQGAGDKENSSAGGRIDGRDGSTYAFSASVAVETAADPGTDSWAVHQKAVSITPLQPALLSLGNCQNPELWTSLGFTPLD